MRIRWDGPVHKIRILGDQIWRAGSVRDVDAAIAAQCLTHPGDPFSVDASEPLLEIVSVQQAELLALAGVGSVRDLSCLDGAGAKAMAAVVGVTRRTAGRWVRKAKGLVEAADCDPLRAEDEDSETEVCR